MRLIIILLVVFISINLTIAKHDKLKKEKNEEQNKSKSEESIESNDGNIKTNEKRKNRRTEIKENKKIKMLNQKLIQNCKRNPEATRRQKKMCKRNVQQCSKRVHQTLPSDEILFETFFLDLYHQCALDRNTKMNIAKACLSANFEPEICGSEEIVAAVLEELARKMISMDEDEEIEEMIALNLQSESEDFLNTDSVHLNVQEEEEDQIRKKRKVTTKHLNKLKKKIDLNEALTISARDCLVNETLADNLNSRMPKNLMKIYIQVVTSMFGTNQVDEQNGGPDVFHETLKEVLEECQIKKLDCCVASAAKQSESSLNPFGIQMFKKVEELTMKNVLIDAASKLSGSCEVNNIKTSLINHCADFTSNLY